MKKLLASACAVAALSMAAPASAQGILGDLLGGLFGSSSRVNNYDERIGVAYQRGEISEFAARDLQNRYYDLRRLEQQYRQGGLSRDERYDLQHRVSDFETRFELARRDRGRWDERVRYGSRDGAWCPPGLAKKGNSCLPPGQASKQDSRYERDNERYGEDNRYGDGGRYGNDDRNDEDSSYRAGNRYVWQRDQNGRLIQIDRRTGRVVGRR